MATNETAAHRALKRASLFWAQTSQFPYAGLEVRVPNSNFRADAAACSAIRSRQKIPGGSTLSYLAPEHTVIFECKQSRPDFLKDTRSMGETRNRIHELQAEKQRIEASLLHHYPNLRKGESLFPEYDQHDLDQLNHEPYRKVLDELASLEKAIYGRTKFDRMVRYQCANLFYLVCMPEIFELHEVPMPWGLLVADPETLDSETPSLEIIRQPTLQQIPEERKIDLLLQITRAGTRETNKAQDLSSASINETRRKS